MGGIVNPQMHDCYKFKATLDNFMEELTIKDSFDGCVLPPNSLVVYLQYQLLGTNNSEKDLLPTIPVSEFPENISLITCSTMLDQIVP